MAAPGGLAQITPQTHDIEAKPKRPEADLRLDRNLRLAGAIAAAVALALFSLSAAYLAFVASGSEQVTPVAREWARGTLSAIIGGIVGFAFAKK